MAQIQFAELLSGTKRLFTGIQAKKPNGIMETLNSDDNGALLTKQTGSIPAGSNNIGKVDVNSMPEIEIKNDSGNPIPVNSVITQNALSTAVTMHNATTAIDAGTLLGVSGMGIASLSISGTFVATIEFQGLAADGKWYKINAKHRGSATISAQTTTIGLYELNCSGLSAIRAYIVSYTSGSITVKGVAQPLAPTSDTVQLSGSNLKKINISSRNCPAGSFTLLTQIYVSEGVKSINGCFKSSDAAFPCALYAQNTLKSGAAGTSTSQATATQNKADFQFTLSADSAQVYFYNADTTSHNIDADILGWAN